MAPKAPLSLGCTSRSLLFPLCEALPDTHTDTQTPTIIWIDFGYDNGLPYTIRFSLILTPKISAYALKTVLAHFIHLAMFFLPELLLVSNNLMISSWLNLWGCTFTTCITKVTGAGDKTCLLNSLPKSALCSNTWQTNSNLKQKWKTIESLVI